MRGAALAVVLAGCRSVLGIDPVIEHCTSNADCAAVCDLPRGECVPCTPSQAQFCSGTTPACSAANTCVACEQHRDCASFACMPDGSCALEGNVAYVAPTGVGTECLANAPCGTVAAAIATRRPVIKLAAGTFDSSTVIDLAAPVAIISDGATLRRTTAGPVVTASASASLADVQLTHAQLLDTTDDGIDMRASSLALLRTQIHDNNGSGIVTLGGTLAVARSTIAFNSAGGIVIKSSEFQIIGNMVIANGSFTSVVGGLSISTMFAPTNRLDLNTFTRNLAQSASAIACDAGSAFVARNNIIWNNDSTPVGGSCLHAYTLVGPETLPAALDGGHVIDADPQLVGTFDAHVSPTSPVRRAGDPGSDLSGVAAFDIDGQPRSAPPDLGADETP